MEYQNHPYNNFDHSCSHYNISPISSPQRNEEEESEKSLYLLDTPLNNYRTVIGSTNYQFINEYNSTNYGSFPIEDNLNEANEIRNETESVENFKDDLLITLDTLEVKEVNLKNSMTCEVCWYDGFFLDYTQEQQDELLKKIGANVGDKIRIILAKE